MENPILTISILISNKYDNVKKCLESVTPILNQVDAELILTDTGCDAPLRSLLEEYTDHIIDYQWCDNFADARNVGLREAKGEWFLYVDDDEAFDQIEDLVHFFQSGEYKSYVGALYVQRNYLDYDGQEYIDHNVSRCFKMSNEAKFIHRVHEAYTGVDEGEKRLLNTFVHHYGYVYASEEERLAKYNRNNPLIVQECEENPDDTRMWYQWVIGQYDIQNWDKAIEIATEVIQKESDSEFWDACHNEILFCYMKKGDYQQVIKYGEEFLKKQIYPYDGLGILEYLVRAYFEVKDYKSVCRTGDYALHEYLKYREKPETFNIQQLSRTKFVQDEEIIDTVLRFLVASLRMENEAAIKLCCNHIIKDLVTMALSKASNVVWLKKEITRMDMNVRKKALLSRVVPEKIAEQETRPDYEEAFDAYGVLDLKSVCLDFSPDFFEGETRDGFYIEPLMKNAWAAGLEVLHKVDILCQELDIPYFADWGTLLGAIRHKGFIPWDDDIDIGVLRKDYNKLKYAINHCQNELRMLDVYNEKNWGQHAFRIANGVDFTLDRELIKRYHGFPFIAGIDVFVIDNVPRDKELQKEQYDVLRTISEIEHIRNQMEEYEPTDKEYANGVKMEKMRIEKLKRICHVSFSKERPTNQELFILKDEVLSLYTDKDSDYYTVPHRLAGGQEYYLPKEVFAERLRVPFENIEISVPGGYDKILRLNYGDNYMTPINRGGGHNYPFYGVLIDELSEIRKDASKEDTLKYIDAVSSGYYKNFLSQKTEPTIKYDDLGEAGEINRIQAAQIEVLEEIKRICRKIDTRYFAISTTLEDVVAYQDYREDSTDLHIGMFREDYIKFMNSLPTELGTWFNYMSIYKDGSHEDMRSYIITDGYMVDSERYLERFHGCSYVVGVDISPFDMVDVDEDMDQVRMDMVVALLKTAAIVPKCPPYSEGILELVSNWEEKLDLKVDREKDLRNEFMKMVDKVASSYRLESDYVRVTPELQEGQNIVYARKLFDNVVELPFGRTTMAVPGGYQEMTGVKHNAKD